MTTELSGLTLTRKVFEPAETHFTPGERSMVAWITTDCVDHERDVVVSSGIDYKTFFLGKTPEDGNPCVLAFHDFGRWPLGRCEWVKIKQSREFNGLYAKTIFDDDPETEAVWRKIKSRSLRGISIGFRPPDNLQPGEWGPPTKDELARRPDWKGAERIIRRCVLLEYSVCSLPMNPQALVAAVNKGVHRPVFTLSKVTEMDETPEVEVEEEKAAKPCDCDKADCDACQERLRTKDVDEEEEGAEAKAATDADFEVEAEAPDDDDEPEPEELGPLKRYDHVNVKAPHYKGFGRIESIHTKGHVPHAEQDMMGSKEDPAACVKCYKAMGDGHAPTEHHVAARVAHLSKMESPMVPPSKGKRASWDTATKAESDPEPLPPLVALTESEVQQEAIRQSVEASVKRINELFGVV